ncbi:MAG: anaerobic ribonucleoside-triphosphate reductase [Spirochaetia bacterium]|jgi:ribonucleoside-triphosphate reductase|nr:anaerobic ribonucleoside-triphosphate reductase [Spirochaetia bacterium]
MERLQQIDEQIKALEEERLAVTGRETEVYTRIVGYYRAVKNWNKGKREEYRHRICFSSLEHDKKKNASAGGERDSRDSKAAVFENENRENITSYYYFYRKTCPNCPPVKRYIEKTEIRGEFIDADTPEGKIMAGEMQVLSVPTVIFTNIQDREVARANNAQEIKAILPAALVCAV